MRFLADWLHLVLDWNVRTYRGDDTLISLEDCYLLEFCEDGVKTVQYELEDFGLPPTLGNISECCQGCHSSFHDSVAKLHMLKEGLIPGMLRLSKRLVLWGRILFFIAPQHWKNPASWVDTPYDQYGEIRLIECWSLKDFWEIELFGWLAFGIRNGKFFTNTRTNGTPTEHWINLKRDPAWHRTNWRIKSSSR